MIKFIVQGKERQLIGIGLSEGNIQLLKAGRPVLIRGPEIGIDYDIVILYGKTEQAMKIELEPFIGPRTKIHDGL